VSECRVSSVRLSLSRASKVEYALPGLEHDRRAADSAAGTGAGVRAGHDTSTVSLALMAFLLFTEHVLLSDTTVPCTLATVDAGNVFKLAQCLREQ
jgi:hypothetical protein